MLPTVAPDDDIDAELASDARVPRQRLANEQRVAATPGPSCLPSRSASNAASAEPHLPPTCLTRQREEVLAAGSSQCAHDAPQK